MARLLKPILLAHCLLVSMTVNAAIPSIEYQVKASLIFNFIHFIEWPAEAFQEGLNHLVICQMGANTYGTALKELEGEVVQGKTLTVQYYPHREELSEQIANRCHIIIFSQISPASIGNMIASLANKPILTIGEANNFLESGGIIEFKIVDERVRFEINLDAAKHSRLVMSSKLLRLASNVISSNSYDRLSE